MLEPTFSQAARVQHPPAYQRGPKAIHKARGYGVGDVDEAAQGSRVERTGEIHARRNPPAFGESLIKEGGAESRAAGDDGRGSVRRTRQHEPHANPARDAGGDKYGEVRCKGCSHQHRK